MKSCSDCCVGHNLVAFFLSGEVAKFPKVVLFWIIILVVILRKLKDVIAKTHTHFYLYIILEVRCFVFTDYHLLTVWYLLIFIFLMFLSKQSRYTSRNFFRSQRHSKMSKGYCSQNHCVLMHLSKNHIYVPDSVKLTEYLIGVNV